MCEDEPGGAVEQGEYPAGDDDPPRSTHGADVLEVQVINPWTLDLIIFSAILSLLL